jgi:hypothetical protein
MRDRELADALCEVQVQSGPKREGRCSLSKEMLALGCEMVAQVGRRSRHCPGLAQAEHVADVPQHLKVSLVSVRHDERMNH